jgi:hypothetical protein
MFFIFQGFENLCKTFSRFKLPMKKSLFATLSALLLIGTSSNPSLAAFPLPGDDPHERHILPFRFNEYAINSCQDVRIQVFD